MALRLPFLTPRISLKTASTLCKSLATLLDAGVPLLKALDTVSKKTGDARCRSHLADVRQRIQEGAEISEALRERQGYFPPLMTDMVTIGEHTGALPEILSGLSSHYDNLAKLRRTFLGAIALPVIQLFAAIGIIALMILVLGLIASAGGNKPIDVLGLGLYGPAGALKFLGTVAAVLGIVVLAWFLASESFATRRSLDRWLLKIPVVGTCLQSFALARFSWSLGLTQQTGMPLPKSLDISLRATGNGAFAGATDEVRHWVMQGDELTEALAQTDLFPEDYLQMLQVAETSGTIPETLQRLSPEFEDQARRSLSTLATVASYGVWLMVAACIIFVIFRIALWYVGMLQGAVNDAFR
ncbi:MAG: type II secretion system F family protein [Planctomycetaceae bacterium]|jgi:type IV pilus assembly protein PilC